MVVMVVVGNGGGDGGGDGSGDGGIGGGDGVGSDDVFHRWKNP